TTINGKPAKDFWEDVEAKKSARLDDAWLKKVAALPAAKQVEAVVAELKKRNPGFDGKVTSRIKGTVVTDLQFITDQVTDLAPVRALPGLRALDCRGSAAGKGKLVDLSPLRGMKLTDLNCGSTKVSDLSPLKGMNLRTVGFFSTPVRDLAPLKGMNLTDLNCAATNVSDLAPLKDTELRSLSCAHTSVSDLSPLKDLKLTDLNCGSTSV